MANKSSKAIPRYDLKLNLYYDIDSMFASGGGYSGYSMSNRAVRAYQNGEKPITKWTKTAMLEELSEYAEYKDIDINDIGVDKLTTKELQDNFLERSSWHHTGTFYRETNFYKIKDDSSARLTKDGIDAIIRSRAPRKNKTSEEKAKAEENKRVLHDSKAVYTKLDTIMASNITGLKSLKCVFNRWSSGKMDIDEQYQKAVDQIRAKDAPKVEQWRKLPPDHRRQKDVRLFDSDIEAYIDRNYLSDNRRNAKVLQGIKAKIGTPQENLQ